MSEAMQCDIVTPVRRVYSATATFVALPAAEGEMGVMAMHAPMVVTLNAGEVRLQVEEAQEMQHFAVAGGYAEISGSKVIILALRAAEVSEIDTNEVQTKIGELEDKLAGFAEDDSRRAYLNEELAWNKLLDHLASA